VLRVRPLVLWERRALSVVDVVVEIVLRNRQSHYLEYYRLVVDGSSWNSHLDLNEKSTFWSRVATGREVVIVDGLEDLCRMKEVLDRRVC